jgi:hypothetical protein
MEVVLRRLLPYRLFKAGYPGCCQIHARNYWFVVWDIPPEGEMTYKLGLN